MRPEFGDILKWRPAGNDEEFESARFMYIGPHSRSILDDEEIYINVLCIKPTPGSDWEKDIIGSMNEPTPVQLEHMELAQ